jgi:CRISPR-associated endonuclease/helicase Cas3
LFIVGQRHKFNPVTGVAPVNTTKKNLLTIYKESDWRNLPMIKSLTALASLLHDWGKATKLFQQKLVYSTKKHKNTFIPDPLRHEWISYLLFVAFVNLNKNENNDDKNWLQQLSQGKINETDIINELVNIKDNDKQDFKLPPIAGLIGWLIVSHHKLPVDVNEVTMESCDEISILVTKIKSSWGYDNSNHEKNNENRLKSCFIFERQLLTNSQEWLKELKKWSNRLLNEHDDIIVSIKDNSIRYTLFLARLCLILGDHSFSSQDKSANKNNNSNELYANTLFFSDKFNQFLDEHLLGVCKIAVSIPNLLQRLATDLPKAKDVKLMQHKDFKWQESATDKIKKERNPKNGFFAINIASMGRGKTIGNAKIMKALSDDSNSLRYSIALGLRTLTLQTGDEYREKIGLDDSELAVLIGSPAITELHQLAKQNEQENQDNPYTQSNNFGSESSEEIFDAYFSDELTGEEFNIEDNKIIKEKFATLFAKNKKAVKLLCAPVVVCTIDHLMPASENTKGRYILPTLRLLSSDLVIDEIDDFTGKDLVAIGRLIFLAAMLGRKVMLSSATITPGMAKNYYRIYQQGWSIFSKTRDNVNSSIDCAWINEFKTTITTITENDSNQACKEYANTHEKYIADHIAKLSTQKILRKAKIINCEHILELSENKNQAYFELIAKTAKELHVDNHGVDNKTGLKVSFGIIRMANIKPTVELTEFLLNYINKDEAIDIKTMAYHSNQVLLLRHEQEKHLDDVLKVRRKSKDNQKIYQNKIIRQHLDNIKKNNSKKQHVMFIVVATSIAEVGRDHDYDWAIIEPSSYRSIIQLIGRILRHRIHQIIKDISTENIAIMQYNIKAINNLDHELDRCFELPGYESYDMQLKQHDLTQIVDTEALANKVDATARISKPKQKDFNPDYNLAHLEHKAINKLLGSLGNDSAAGIDGYISEAWYLTAYPQLLMPFREQHGENIEICLVYDYQKQQSWFSCYDNKHKLQLDSKKIPEKVELTYNINKPLITNTQNLWLNLNYESLITEYAEKKLIKQGKLTTEENLIKTINELVPKYGTLTSYKYSSYNYFDQLGLVKAD